jgi:hypothetical protein
VYYCTFLSSDGFFLISLSRMAAVPMSEALFRFSPDFFTLQIKNVETRNLTYYLKAVYKTAKSQNTEENSDFLCCIF